MLRGLRSTLELPEMAGRGIVRGAQAALGTETRTPVFDTTTGDLLTKGYGAVAGAVGDDPEGIEYRSPNTLGQYAGTIAEFGGGGLGIGALGTLGGAMLGAPAGSLGAGLGQAATGWLGSRLGMTPSASPVARPLMYNLGAQRPIRG